MSKPKKYPSHFDLPATVYCWKNYYETSGHWNVDPPKTVRPIMFYRADNSAYNVAPELLETGEVFLAWFETFMGKAAYAEITCAELDNFRDALKKGRGK